MSTITKQRRNAGRPFQRRNNPSSSNHRRAAHHVGRPDIPLGLTWLPLQSRLITSAAATRAHPRNTNDLDTYADGLAQLVQNLGPLVTIVGIFVSVERDLERASAREAP